MKDVASLLSYIDWSDFGDAARSPTTRALARMIAKVRLSPDALSARIIHESQAQIKTLVEEINAKLADLQSLQRESWKAEVRARVLPAFELRETPSDASRSADLLALRKAFVKIMPDWRWHQELAQEILEEDQGPDSTVRREQLLAKLELPRPEEIEEKPPVERKEALLGAVTGLCQTFSEIALIEEILIGNERALEMRSLSLLQRLVRWFQRNLGRVDERSYEISIRESPKGESRRVTLDFLQFIAELRETQGILRELLDRAGAGPRRIETMPEEELCDLLDWLSAQLRVVHRKMEGLNEMFQLRAVREPGIRARSIKLEMLRIENGIARAGAVRGECSGTRPDGEPPPTAITGPGALDH
jgi:hypothetical protein